MENLQILYMILCRAEYVLLLLNKIKIGQTNTLKLQSYKVTFLISNSYIIVTRYTVQSFNCRQLMPTIQNIFLQFVSTTILFPFL